MKALRTLHINIKNNFSKEIVMLSVLILSLITFAYFCVILWDILIDNFGGIIISFVDWFNYVVYGFIDFDKEMPNGMTFFIRLLILLVQSSITIFLTACAVDENKYNPYIMIIVWVIQQLAGILGYLSVFMTSIVIIGMCLSMGIKTYDYKKIIYVIKINGLIFITMTCFHLFANHIFKPTFDSIMTDDINKMPVNEYGTTLATLLFISVISAFIFICCCVYGSIFYGYWIAFSYFILSDVRIDDISTIVPDMPCQYKGYVLYTTDGKIDEKKVRWYYIVQYVDLYRIIAVNILMAILCPIMIYNAFFKCAILFFITFPTIIEIMLRLCRSFIHTMVVMRYKYNTGENKII